MRVVKLPAKHDVFVGRPSLYGNPFSHLEDSAAEFRVRTREHAVEAFALWVRLPEQEQLRRVIVEQLTGRVLGCYCYPLPCHATTLLQITRSGGGVVFLDEDWMRRRLKELIICPST